MRRIALPAACAAVLIASPGNAEAQRWVGGSGTWDEKSNWFPAQVPTGTSGVEIVGNPKIADGVHATSAFASIGELEEASGIVSVLGTGADWGNSGEIRAGARRKSLGGIELQAGGKVTAGFLELAWDPTSEGTLSVSGSGSLFTANGINIGRAGMGRMKVEDGGKLALGALNVGLLAGSLGEALVTGAGTSMDISNIVRVGYGGNGQLTLDSRAQAKSVNVVVGGGTPDTSDGQPGIGRMTMSGRSSWVASGQLVVGSTTGTFAPFSEGNLRIDGGSTFSAASHARIGLGSKGEVTINGSGSRLSVGSGTLDSYIGIDGVGKLSVLNGGVASFDNARLLLGISPTGPASVVVDGAGSTLRSTGPVTVAVNGSALVTVDNGGKLVAPSIWIGTRLLGGGVYEPGRVVVRGGSDPALRGAIETALITGLGVLEFDGGVLRATGHQSNLIQPGSLAPLAIASRGAFIDSNGFEIAIQRPFTGSGGLTKQGEGTLTLAAPGSAYLGATTIERGNLRFAYPFPAPEGFLPRHAALVIGNAADAGAAKLDLNGFDQQVGGLVSTGAGMSRVVTNSASRASTLTVDQSVNTEYAGELSGALSLVKRGGGELVLAGSNTHTAATRVEQGTLAVNGSLTGDVLVTGPGVLKGTGSIDGTVTVDAGGIYAPGASPGRMTVGGLMLLAGGILELEIGSTHDEVVIFGDARLAGTLQLSFLAGWMPEAGNALTLLDVRGERTGNFGDVLQEGLPPGLRYGLNFESGRLMLTAAPVPEPLSVFLMLSGLAVLFICGVKQRSLQVTEGISYLPGSTPCAYAPSHAFCMLREGETSHAVRLRQSGD